MPRLATWLWALFGLLPGAAHADLILHHSIDIHNPARSPVARSQVTTRLKASRLCSEFRVTAIYDYAAGQVTLVNTASKRFARIPLASYPVELPGKEAERPSEIRLRQDALKPTGRTAVLHGLRAAEYHGSLALVTGAGAIHLEIDRWIPPADEFARNPALHELAAFAARAGAGFSMAETLRAAVMEIPDMTEQLIPREWKQLLAADDPLVLKMRLSARGEGKYAGRGQQPWEITIELDDVSAGAVPDSFFRVPAEFRPAAKLDVLFP